MSNQFDPPPQKSGGGVLKIILIVCGVLFLACAGICGLIGFGTYRVGSQLMESASELKNAATPIQSILSSNDEVTSKFGTLKFGPPIPADPLSPIDFNDAKFIFPVNGSKENGVANCRVKKTDSSWTILEIKVQLADGTVIDVPPPKDAVAPEFNFDLGNENDKK